MALTPCPPPKTESEWTTLANSIFVGELTKIDEKFTPYSNCMLENPKECLQEDQSTFYFKVSKWKKSNKKETELKLKAAACTVFPHKLKKQLVIFLYNDQIIYFKDN